MQTALGPRVPGTEAHDELARTLASRLGSCADEVHSRHFPVSFSGRTADCENIVGVFRAGTAARGSGGRGTLLLGTHYDTRPRADRERDPAKRELGIVGANDGGSGTAVLLHLLERIVESPRERDVAVAFFDAEDLGDIDGNPFSLGAEHLAAHPIPDLPEPSEVVILDMIGGEEMVLDIDAHIFHHRPSMELTRRIFTLGRRMNAEPFVRDKPDRVKYIVSDHWPFLRKGVASCILIDIDYPPWHTHGDLPEAMCERSMEITEEALSLFLWPHPR